ncbi:unnamed protein product [Closterium sp. Naga37s-1]|nr:unnamed protein product [Closterium sp. Naga37s-1]
MNLVAMNDMDEIYEDHEYGEMGEFEELSVEDDESEDSDDTAASVEAAVKLKEEIVAMEAAAVNGGDGVGVNTFAAAIVVEDEAVNAKCVGVAVKGDIMVKGSKANATAKGRVLTKEEHVEGYETREVLSVEMPRRSERLKKMFQGLDVKALNYKTRKERFKVQELQGSFYTFETVKAWLLRANQKHPKTFQLPESLPPSSVAGGAAGLAATLLLYPFSAVGDHMSLQVNLQVSSGVARYLQPGKYPGLRQALVGVAQQHGASQLFRGVVPKLASMVPASAINFLVFESLKEEIKLASMVPASAINFLVFDSLKKEIKRLRNGKDPSAAHMLISGAIAGAASTIVTHPFELCRREINMSLLPKHATPTGGHLEYNSLRQAMRGILRKEGVRGLYRGVLPSLIELVPATAIGFLVYEMGKRVMVAEGQERRDEVKG